MLPCGTPNSPVASTLQVRVALRVSTAVVSDGGVVIRNIVRVPMLLVILKKVHYYR